MTNKPRSIAMNDEEWEIARKMAKRMRMPISMMFRHYVLDLEQEIGQEKNMSE